MFAVRPLLILMSPRITDRSADCALYIPKRTIWASAACVHVLAFGPTHRYDAHAARWTAGSDIASLDGAWRDLFVNVGWTVYYVGIYRCHDLRHPTLAMLDAAHLGSTTTTAEHTRILRSFFPQGTLNAHCVGLESRASDSDSVYYGEDSGGSTRKCTMDESGGGGVAGERVVHMFNWVGRDRETHMTDVARFAAEPAITTSTYTRVSPYLGIITPTTRSMFTDKDTQAGLVWPLQIQVWVHQRS
ncbi:hypothetical protein B0H11DRAFT_2203550 [Mycena galericulata]|nr:hypothetical protein B0H11DRAFT_2203550 [Mycena galericulata]